MPQYYTVATTDTDNSEATARDCKAQYTAGMPQKSGNYITSFKSSFKTFGGGGQSFLHLDQNSQSNTFIHAKSFKYGIKFSIIYQVDPKEKIAVIGSIKELGEWKDYVCFLEWHQGNYWMNSLPLLTDCSTFQYKYVRYTDRDHVICERGVNRIVNLIHMTSEANSVDDSKLDNSMNKSHWVQCENSI